MLLEGFIQVAGRTCQMARRKLHSRWRRKEGEFSARVPAPLPFWGT
jgi:hypothetical protein